MTDSTSHRAWTRRGTSNDTAVLMVHGIVGSPDHFRPFAECFPKEWSLYSLLLHGHGGMPRDFAKSSMEIWRAQVKGALECLCRRYRRVVLMGHSMGCLLLMEAAQRHSDKVAAMIFLALPLRVHVTPQGVRHALLVTWEKGKANDRPILASKAAYSIRPDKRLWIYLRYLPRYAELLYLAHLSRARLSAVTAPCWVFLSGRDELASMRTMMDLQKHPHIHTRVLNTAMHHYYPTRDMAVLKREITGIVQHLCATPDSQ